MFQQDEGVANAAFVPGFYELALQVETFAITNAAELEQV
jgi:hypothetical protein